MQQEAKISTEMKTSFENMHTGSDSDNDLTIQREKLIKSSAAEYFLCYLLLLK